MNSCTHVPWKIYVPKRRFLLMAGALLFMSFPQPGMSVAADSSPREYLSDTFSERIISAVQEWGELGLNTAVRPPDRPAEKLRILDKSYKRGLGHHANGEILIDLSGAYKSFETEIGIQWQGGKTVGSVVFQVFVNDKKCFDSGIVKESDPSQKIGVSVEGADELRLVVTDAGDGITCDCANWADACLIRDPAATQRPLKVAVDIATFARILTWDPKRTEGTRAGRTQEFPAEDVFLGRELLPGADGTYIVPVTLDGVGCIGLQWYELRFPRQLALQFADAADISPADRVQVQYWVGESAWQGAWRPLSDAAEKIGDGWTWRLGYQDVPRGTEKIRWILPPAENPIILKSLSVYSRSTWKTLDVRIETERPQAGRQGRIEIYNGGIVSPADASSKGQCSWDLSNPLTLKVRYSAPRACKADRTVLRFQIPGGAFGVAVEDLLTNDCVYVPHVGVYVARDPAPITLDQYLQRIATRKTVLARVREMPDQTFARALAKVHNPVQDLGPMMLSLACDNRKFVAHRTGVLVFDVYDRPDDEARPIPKDCRLVPRFGERENRQLTRYLFGGWLPMPTTVVRENGVVYQQKTYVAPVDNDSPPEAPAWLRERALCVAAYTIENTGAEAAEASLTLTLAKDKERVGWQQVEGGLIATTGQRVLAFVDTGKASSLVVTSESGKISISGKLSAGGIASLSVCLPAWKVPPRDYAILAGEEKRSRQMVTYWNDLLGSAMQVELPDPLLTDVIRASQAHCLLAARNEDHGIRVSPWISSDRYGPLESESNSIIRGMGLMGHDDFARRSLEFFIKRYNAAGFLTTGYTVVGTGEHLWTLAEHFNRTQDRAWLESVSPEVARVCQWIVRQRTKTKGLDARGEKMPEYGLMPPGVSADWNRYAYRFFNDAQYCTGLEAAARALATINHPNAQALLEEARQYREDIVRAYRWTQARSPVVPLDDGTWVPASPALLGCFGNVEESMPGEDWNRSWAYSVELGAHHLVANRVLDPAADDVAWMVNYLEDAQFLRSGMGDYPEERNRNDFFNLGGFAKVQPYYARIAEVYALRDDVKPFVRSYFNAIPSLLSLENLSFWEHFNNQGGWNKTHETGWFLCQSRTMLVSERGDELWLAPFVPAHWFKDGMRIVVRNAPTDFGKVAYTIMSSVNSGFVQAVILPPARRAPKRIVVRLRHPDGKTISAATVNGVAHKNFDRARECVTIESISGPTTVRVQY